MSKETIIDEFSFIEILSTKNKCEYEIYEKGRPLGNLQINFSDEFMKFSPNSNTSSRYKMSEVTKNIKYKVEGFSIQISIENKRELVWDSRGQKIVFGTNVNNAKNAWLAPAKSWKNNKNVW